jgi:hypothetical protein
VKYAESMQEPAPALKPRYDEIADQSGLFIDARIPALRANPLQQLWREHLLAQAMLMRGDYDEGRFVVIAPRLNYHVQNAVGGYRCQLNETAGKHVGFGSLTLEQMVEAIGRAGEPDYARELFFRYLDWHAVDQAVGRCSFGRRRVAEALGSSKTPGIKADRTTRGVSTLFSRSAP